MMKIIRNNSNIAKSEIDKLKKDNAQSKVQHNHTAQQSDDN